MASAAPVDEHDLRTLRSIAESALPVPQADVETIAALAGRLERVVLLPASERGAALQQAIKRPDVDAVRAAAQRAREARESPAGPSALAERLDELVTKLSAYLPPRNGG